MPSSVTLGYWNIRGLAQRIRLLLQYLKVPYKQVFFTPETQNEWFGKLKPQYLKLNPAANLPFLLDGDKLVCQSDAIMVYLCLRQKRDDLLGLTGDDQVQIATVMGVYKDLARAFSGYAYGQRSYQQIKQQAIKSFQPSLQKLNGLLGEKEWFASKLSYCDIILGDFFQVYSLFNEKFGAEYPRLKHLQERMWDLEGIKQYLKSDRFKQRPINWYPEAKWF